jgi:hypothetical protein
MGDVVRGLRQALVMLLFSAVPALAVAELWFAPQGGEGRSKVAIAVIVIGGACCSARADSGGRPRALGSDS